MEGPRFLLFKSDRDGLQLLVRLEGESVWLSQGQMAELFQRDQSVIARHIANIFAEGELAMESNMHRMHIAGADRPVAFYSLDVIISVGYRVRSHVGTQFRIWATQRIREYIVKGFVLDDQRLKESKGPVDYFDELLERIRDIRSSEQQLYKRVREICALSLDYDGSSKESQRFFQVVQNKLHYAATGVTAAEIVSQRIDCEKPNMGLSNWPGEKVRKKDVAIAKNYLNPDEIGTLNLLVAQYLDFAELQAKSQKPMRMLQWVAKLDDILTLNDRPILLGPGKVSRRDVEILAQSQYAAFEVRRHQEQVNSLDPIADLRDAAKSLEARKPRGKKKG